MGLGTRFDPRGVATPVGVLGDLLDELVSALAKTAKGGESIECIHTLPRSTSHPRSTDGVPGLYPNFRATEDSV